MIFPRIASVFCAILVLLPVSHVGSIAVQHERDLNVRWQITCNSNKKKKKPLELAVIICIPGCDCIFKISWWINGIEYLSGDDGPLPRVLGLGPCDDTVCCLQHSIQTIWYVVLSLSFCMRIKEDFSKSHLSACEKLYFGTKYKKSYSREEDRAVRYAVNLILILI